MKRILVLSDSFNGYGAEYMIGWVGSMLAENGYDVIFCSPFDSKKDGRLSDKGKFIGLGLSRNANPLLKILQYFVFSAWNVCKICKKHNVDIIVTFKENPLCIALLAKIFTGVKHLHSERDDPYNRDTISSKIKMWLYRFTDHIVFQTKGAQDFFCNKISSRSTIIPNPVTIPEIKWSQSNSKKTIANVGRLNIRYKRQDILLHAFSRIKDELDGWSLVFYGDGYDMEELKTLAKDLDVYERVEFAGKISNVCERLVNDGIFVLTSDTEGLPNVLLEAMSLGMPVIATDCSPGGAKALVSEDNGILVERGNISQVAQAILNLVADAPKTRLLAQNARASVSKYAPNTISEKWINVINKI